MRRKIPSTAALTAFEAAARHQSFTKAALELSVTQSAVCRQVGTLEDFLGVKLFRRGRHGVALTEAGQDYSRRVAVRLDEVERDTLDLMGRAGQGGALELGVVPTFAARWLLPRLGRFHRLHPGITVHLSSRTRPFLFAQSGLDAAIHASDGGWPGTQAFPLMNEALVAVGSPALVGAAATPGDLARLPLLQMSTRPYAWRHWFGRQGLSVPHDLAGPRMELFTMTVEAACQGLGVALVPTLFVEAELADGRLRAVGPPQPSDRGYFLIVPEARAEEPLIVAFRDWVIGEARG
jgi:LysR family glycine cleavage system transcriptional activator